ncbi:hypothetical protein ACFXPY_17325 [Streptomyces sp. NPDC059153]|uniref:hypothetical protein n=1 Tax=unclassified Streptomyces TaxID=2593676 RepID=UPI00367C8C14
MDTLPPEQTVLTAILDNGDLRHSGNGATDISIGEVGTSRVRLLAISATEPVLVLTRRL